MNSHCPCDAGVGSENGCIAQTMYREPSKSGRPPFPPPLLQQLFLGMAQLQQSHFPKAIHLPELRGFGIGIMKIKWKLLRYTGVILGII